MKKTKLIELPPSMDEVVLDGAGVVSVEPQAWRNMWGWTGKGSVEASPIRASVLRNPAGDRGAWLGDLFCIILGGCLRIFVIHYQHHE